MYIVPYLFPQGARIATFANMATGMTIDNAADYEVIDIESEER